MAKDAIKEQHESIATPSDDEEDLDLDEDDDDDDYTGGTNLLLFYFEGCLIVVFIDRHLF